MHVQPKPRPARGFGHFGNRAIPAHPFLAAKEAPRSADLERPVSDPAQVRPALSLLAILLNASGAQAGEAMAVDRVLPGQEFLDRERVAAAGLFK